ncbi:MAG: LpqB family beta-propeller domain-containing protein [Micrococcales bacterium]|nr:LpqB family beta-propeller domain-containing protein [Micrococcales bacterium]
MRRLFLLKARVGIGRIATILVAALALGACAELPVTGPVREGVKGGTAVEPVLQALAARPLPGASPEQIVQGFLQAVMAGGSDGYEVARSYLAEPAATIWDPSAEVALYRRGEDPILVSNVTGTSLTLSFTQISRLDQDGRFSLIDSTEQHQRFGLVSVENQWRISQVPPGVVLPQDVFANDFVNALVYFPAAEGRMMVPDVHYFLRRSAATATTQAFLDGPPAYLEGVVNLPLPPGVRLTTEVVRVQEGLARVNLGSELHRATENELSMLVACLNASLLSLPEVTGVTLEVDGQPLDQVASLPLETEPLAGEGVYYLGYGGLWRLNPRPERLAGYEKSLDWETLTVDPNGLRIAGRQDGKVMVIGASKEAEEWPTRNQATAGPIYDSAGRLWVGAGQSVYWFSYDGQPTQVWTSWMSGRRVVGLAPARDGARLAVLSESLFDGTTRLDLVGIERANGAPFRLGEPLTITSLPGKPASIAWYDQVTLAVLAPTELGPATVQLIGVGSASQVLGAPSDPSTSLAAGRASDGLYVTGEAGGLFEYDPQALVWTSVATGARAVTYRA